ncbi:MAG TPA: GNAT family N-acetyltransferase [Pyrinomonadaceae bacterium]|nr:GNAT family N-acetyltransferase [Chloracidobacterium sp.]MBP9935168.1 GNAT family N-acetyltransferase [Pyrinomonadaceae bacterium]MBK7803404.1 GNAT family N-acetyltransferase [Chloracidobacterium sp.]MBK9438655.1 GNAT family N-acetyltransferase [Chloracidobacterium sp.]MBK9766710.1 GNAT family N-acetyltransferase [Chloracidobacterium sp.]
MKLIAETQRLVIREMDSAVDAEFIFAILNTPKFIRFIGDRGVRSVEQAEDFIEDRYRQSYREHGFGLWTVTLKHGVQIGMCGFVKRPHLDHADLGFAFLPDYERQGFGFESASAILKVGKEELNFSTVLAITSLENKASGNLLKKLNFNFNGIETMPDGEQLKIFSTTL